MNPAMLENPWKRVEEVLGVPPCVTSIRGDFGRLHEGRRPGTVHFASDVPHDDGDGGGGSDDDEGGEGDGADGGAATGAGDPPATAAAPSAPASTLLPAPAASAGSAAAAARLVPSAVASSRAPLALPPPRHAGAAPQQRPAPREPQRSGGSRHAEYLERVSRYDETRALLDELMGADRDAALQSEAAADPLGVASGAGES